MRKFRVPSVMSEATRKDFLEQLGLNCPKWDSILASYENFPVGERRDVIGLLARCKKFPQGEGFKSGDASHTGFSTSKTTLHREIIRRHLESGGSVISLDLEGDPGIDPEILNQFDLEQK